MNHMTYAAFESDISIVAGMVPFPIHHANLVAGPTEVELNLSYLQATSQGLTPRFVLLTNPNNRLATVYKPTVLQQTVHWARRKGLHTSVDEVYELSTHQVSTNKELLVVVVMDKGFKGKFVATHHQ
jgi:aspartate/methionine/tyrosine aminotransferase